MRGKTRQPPDSTVVGRDRFHGFHRDRLFVELAVFLGEAFFGRQVAFRIDRARPWILFVGTGIRFRFGRVVDVAAAEFGSLEARDRLAQMTN